MQAVRFNTVISSPRTQPAFAGAVPTDTPAGDGSPVIRTSPNRVLRPRTMLPLIFAVVAAYAGHILGQASKLSDATLAENTLPPALKAIERELDPYFTRGRSEYAPKAPSVKEDWSLKNLRKQAGELMESVYKYDKFDMAAFEEKLKTDSAFRSKFKNVLKHFAQRVDKLSRRHPAMIEKLVSALELPSPQSTAFINQFRELRYAAPEAESLGYAQRIVGLGMALAPSEEQEQVGRILNTVMFEEGPQAKLVVDKLYWGSWGTYALASLFLSASLASMGAGKPLGATARGFKKYYLGR